LKKREEPGTKRGGESSPQKGKNFRRRERSPPPPREPGGKKKRVISEAPFEKKGRGTSPSGEVPLRLDRQGAGVRSGRLKVRRFQQCKEQGATRVGTAGPGTQGSGLKTNESNEKESHCHEKPGEEGKFPVFCLRGGGAGNPWVSQKRGGGSGVFFGCCRGATQKEKRDQGGRGGGGKWVGSVCGVTSCRQVTREKGGGKKK